MTSRSRRCWVVATAGVWTEVTLLICHSSGGRETPAGLSRQLHCSFIPRPVLWGRSSEIARAPEVAMRVNIAWPERLLRLAAGILVLGLYGALPPPWRYLTLVGLLPFGTALRGYCPLRAALARRRA